ncbi:MAG: 50S ribosome-binding GTPase, partial [Selenomonadales bacterium]|nr:50S ribosome-binding GTPase [Selenomonadales bacterium]
MNRRGGFFRWWGGLFCAIRSANGQSDGSGDDGRKGHRGRGRTVDDGQKGHLPNHGRTVVLAGNPNVGKSVFFTALSGIYREVSNYAGTTVDVGCARLGHDTLIDTPGVYGIGSASEEERVAREVILSADIVINIVDAVHLPRDLFLTIQLIEMGIPLVVVLNMMDEVEKRGIVIDREKLSHLLGVPVIGASGALGVGIDEVKRNIGSARIGRIDDDMRAMLAEAMAEGLPQRTALLSLEEDASPCGQDAKKGGVLSWDMVSCGRCVGCGKARLGLLDSDRQLG